MVLLMDDILPYDAAVIDSYDGHSFVFKFSHDSDIGVTFVKASISESVVVRYDGVQKLTVEHVHDDSKGTGS